MNFTFDLTKQDYLDFNLFTVKNYKTYKKQKKTSQILFAAAPLFVFLMDWLLEGKLSPTFTDAVGFFTMALLSVLFWIYSPKLYDKITQRNTEKILFKEGKVNVLGERKMFFEEEHVRCITRYGESITKYEMITDIQESDTAIYIYISLAMAIIIPLRVFESENEKKEFTRFIRLKIKNGKDG